MSFTLRWVGRDELDRVSLCRTRCFAHQASQSDRITSATTVDCRAADGDYLLAEEAGQAIGTATALAFRMWVRGGPVDTQGIAWVGTLKTHRRASIGARGQGVASQIMRAALNRARERGQALSALMPWRGSFYEHFGYGLVERRNAWFIPMSLLPTGPCDGFEFIDAADPALVACRQRMVEAGQCDIERPLPSWARCHSLWADGFSFADRADDGSVRSWMYLQHEASNGKDHLKMLDFARLNPQDLLRQLRFLGSLKDQYAGVWLYLPVDVPLNLLLREHQIPHRPVNHEVAQWQAHTRMQVQVLNHRKLIESMVRLPEDVRGRVTVAVRETGGAVSIFTIEMEHGRATVKHSSQSVDVECTATTWAPIVLGDLPASTAARHGLINASNPAALSILDAFSAGPPPFCNEYF